MVRIFFIDAPNCNLSFYRLLTKTNHSYTLAGGEVGSAAIKWIPTGGLFVTGGLTPKNIKFIDGPTTEFMISYLDKGRVSPILEQIPLYAVLVEDLGIRGAHKKAHDTFQDNDNQHKRMVSVFEKRLMLALVAATAFAAGAFLGCTRK
jgi:hypothetical protein